MVADGQAEGCARQIVRAAGSTTRVSVSVLQKNDADYRFACGLPGRFGGSFDFGALASAGRKAPRGPLTGRRDAQAGKGTRLSRRDIRAPEGGSKTVIGYKEARRARLDQAARKNRRLFNTGTGDKNTRKPGRDARWQPARRRGTVISRVGSITTTRSQREFKKKKTARVKQSCERLLVSFFTQWPKRPAWNVVLDKNRRLFPLSEASPRPRQSW